MNVINDTDHDQYHKNFLIVNIEPVTSLFSPTLFVCQSSFYIISSVIVVCYPEKIEIIWMRTRLKQFPPPRSLSTLVPYFIGILSAMCRPSSGGWLNSLKYICITSCIALPEHIINFKWLFKRFVCWIIMFCYVFRTERNQQK